MTAPRVTRDDLSAAYRLGEAAYAVPGAVRAPALDGSLAALVGERPVGTGAAALFESWLMGWDAAADRAALVEP